MTKFTLYNDDCLNVLKSMDDNSMDSCVTDPPYGLSFMGKSWDYDVPKKEIWDQVFRVLKPGAHLLAFFGSRTYHRGVVQIEDAGFEIRDQIMWIYGSGFPKSHDIGKNVEKIKVGGKKNLKQIGTKRGIKVETGTSGFSYSKEYVPGKSMGGKQIGGDIPVYEVDNDWKGWGTALKPAHEPIVVARKPLLEKSVAANVLKYGTGALNIDDCRVGNEQRTYSLKGGQNLNKLSRPTGNDSDDAKGCGAYGIGAKQISIGETTVNGRWPANVIHDGSDEVVSQFPQTGSGNNKQPYSYTGSEYNNRDTSMFNGDKPQAPSNYNDSVSSSRFFYCAKASKSDRDEGLQDFLEKKVVTFQTGNSASGNPSSISANGNTQYKNIHPTVKPTELMKYLCRLVTPKNGTVLDPFMGSGSTGKAALQEGFKFVGIEMNKEYFDIANMRIKNSIEKNLFDVFFESDEKST
jgi:DNA modification methylase